MIQFPFNVNPEVSIAKSAFNFDMFNRLLAYKIFSSAWDRAASAFVVCYGLLCIWAYVTNKKEKKDFNYYTLYISMATFIILFALLSECHPYWIVFLSPFLILSVFNNPKYLKVNILLEMGFALTFVCERMYVFWGVFGGSTTFDYLLIRKLGRRNVGERIPLKYLLDKFYYEDFRAAILGIFFLCIFALLIINLPRKLNIQKEEVKIERGIMWLRSGILAFYVIMELLIVIFDFGTLYW